VTPADLPPHYRRAVGQLLCFAAWMTVIGLLTGILFQESAKRLDLGEVTPGLWLAATQRLGLLHGHVIVMTVLVPIAMAAALFLATWIGGAVVGPRPLAWLTRGYLPGAALALGLMLYKGYHVLLSVRGGATDLAAVDGTLFGGITGLRHGVYGLVHVAMAVSLSVFVIALARSLKGAGRAAD